MPLSSSRAWHIPLVLGAYGWLVWLPSMSAEDFERMRQEHHRQAASRREAGARRVSDEAPAADAPSGHLSREVAPTPKSGDDLDGEGVEEEILFAPKAAARAGALGRPQAGRETASPAPVSPAPPRPGSAAATPVPACPPGFKARPMSATASPQPPLTHGGSAAGLPGGGVALLEALLQGPATAPAKGPSSGASRSGAVSVTPQEGVAQEAAGGGGGRKVSRALALEDSSKEEKEPVEEVGASSGEASVARTGHPADGGPGQGARLGAPGMQEHKVVTLDEVEAGVTGAGPEMGALGEASEESKEASKEAPRGGTDTLSKFTSLVSWLPSLASPGSATAAGPDEAAAKDASAQSTKGGASLVPSTPSFSSWSSTSTVPPATATVPAALGASKPAAAPSDGGEVGPSPAPPGSSSLFGSSLFFPDSIFSWNPGAPSASATGAAAWGAPSAPGSSKASHVLSHGTAPTATPQGTRGPGTAGGAPTGKGAAALPLGVLAAAEHSQQSGKGEQAMQAAQEQSPEGKQATQAAQEPAAGKGLSVSGENGGSTGSLLEILQRYKGDHTPAAHDQDTAKGPPDAQDSDEVSQSAPLPSIDNLLRLNSPLSSPLYLCGASVLWDPSPKSISGQVVVVALFLAQRCGLKFMP